MIVVAIAALIGGRAYHVIDQWALYKDDLARIVLPPYTGLGVYGGIAVRARRRGHLRAEAAPADLALGGHHRAGPVHDAGGGTVGQLLQPGAVRPAHDAALGHSPSSAPIGSRTTRVHTCPVRRDPRQHFQPLFLYESLSGVLGAAFLIWLGFRFRNRLRPGDLALTFFIWYGVVRFALETLRHDNWTFFGVPMAQIVSLLFIVPALAILLWRHRDRDPVDDPPSRPEAATWGAPGSPAAPEQDEDEGEPSADVAVA